MRWKKEGEGDKTVEKTRLSLSGEVEVEMAELRKEQR